MYHCRRRRGGALAGNACCEVDSAGARAIGEAGAANAALFAIALLATSDAALGEQLRKFREMQTSSVLSMTLPEV